MIKLIDTHVHYDDEAFDVDRAEVLSALPENNIELVINAGSNIPSSKMGAALAKEYPHVYFAAGVHPHEAAFCEETWKEELTGLATEPKCVAVGEIGLDYYYDNSPRDKQKELFDAQLGIAAALSLPVIIHSRESFADTIDVLRPWSGIRGVFHCFSGSVESAKIVLDMGFYISLGGPITYKNARKPVAVMEYIPSERLLLETDCPYLTPHPHRGKRNDSRYLEIIATRAAEIRGCDVLDLAEQTSKNCRELFTKIK